MANKQDMINYLNNLNEYLVFLYKDELKKDLFNQKLELILTTQQTLFNQQDALNHSLNQALSLNGLNEYNILKFNTTNKTNMADNDLNFDNLPTTTPAYKMQYNCYLQIPIKTTNNTIKTYDVFVCSANSNDLYLSSNKFDAFKQAEINNHNKNLTLNNIKEQSNEIIADLTTNIDLEQIFQVFAYCKINQLPETAINQIKTLDFAKLSQIVTQMPDYKQITSLFNFHTNKKSTVVLPALLTPSYKNEAYIQLINKQYNTLKLCQTINQNQRDLLIKASGFLKQWINELDFDSNNITSQIYINNIDVNVNYKYWYRKYQQFKQNIAQDDNEFVLACTISISFKMHKNGLEKDIIVTLLNEISDPITLYNLNELAADQFKLKLKTNDTFDFDTYHSKLQAFLNINLQDFIELLKQAQTNLSFSDLTKTSYPYDEFIALVQKAKETKKQESRNRL